ncbi:MAG: hypothetical protein FJY73_02385 [Candidatus Eisenbacteria bacterium]|nr:hypothetical protein [Candidatus Eisenbacteria bacterium]
MAEAEARLSRSRKARETLWRIRRIQRRIDKGYYDRPEIRAEIVESILDALLGNGPRRVP